MDHQNSRHLGGGLGFEHMHYNSNPHFTNPWGSPSPSNSQLYPQSINSNTMGFDAIAKQAQRSSTASLPYSSIPATAPLSATGGFASGQYDSSNLVNMSQDLLNNAQQAYSGAPSTVANYAPTSVPFNPAFGSVAPTSGPQEPRRLSHG